MLVLLCSSGRCLSASIDRSTLRRHRRSGSQPAISGGLLSPFDDYRATITLGSLSFR